MVPDQITRRSKKRACARVPFLNQLAREFSRSKPQIWRICTGTGGSPLRVRILARQAELIRSDANTPRLADNRTGALVAGINAADSAAQPMPETPGEKA